jgi:CRP-like cAMP-binding protein
MNLAQQLQGSPLFKGVSEADREALLQVMRRESYPEGTVLFHKDDVGDTMYLIVQGRIRIFMTDAEGRDITLRYYGPLNMFGEFSPIDQKPRSASAAAAEPLEVLALHRDDFLAFLKERPLVGLEMMRTLVDRLRYTTDYLQKVIDATQQISQGNYDLVDENLSADETDADIQQMLETFVQMVRQVQSREESLKASAEE